MGQNRTLAVKPGYFSGNSKVYSAGPEGLAEQVRALQAQLAGLLVVQLGIDFSVGDSSGAVGQTLVTGDATGGDAENIFTLTGGMLDVPTGHPVVFGGADLPDGVTASTEYYVRRVKVDGAISRTIFQIADEVYKAHLGQVVPMADDGSGTMWIKQQIALPDRFTTHDSTGATTGVLDTQVAATCDTILEGLASVVNVLSTIQAALGMPAVDIGGLTGAVNTVALMDVAATANTSNDDAADFAALAGSGGTYDEMNNYIRTVAYHVNDVAAALGETQMIGFLTKEGDEADDPTTTGIDAVTAATSAVGGAAATVALTEFNAALVDWRAAVGVILQRVSVVSATAQSVDDWTNQLVPTQDTGGAAQVTPGLRTRGA